MATIKKITTAVQDAVIYPILTKEVNGYRGGSNGQSVPSTDGASLTRTAQNAMRELLGWRYRGDDPKGFLAALNKAVDLKMVEGHVESTWKARPFMVHAELGEVTGAQASIYTRAKVASEHALPLLDGLTPIRGDAREDEIESLRAIVRSAWTELVIELGIVSGPRLKRVDEYFRQLLGKSDPKEPVVQKAIANPALVEGILGDLGSRFGFGFDGDTVLTIEEEKNFTNFLILVDYTTSLLQTWAAQKTYLMRNGTPNGTKKFLGTQLVRLSEELAVIVESVHEVYDAMDSVFFGPEERQVALLTFDLLTNTEPITVAELLSWIEQFASVEAPQLLEDCGKNGVRTVSETLKELRNMLNDIVKTP